MNEQQLETIAARYRAGSTDERPARSRMPAALAVVVALTLCVSSAMAQSVCLPAPRLLTTMPMGGQVGTQFELTITGDSIDNATELVFSHPAITATQKRDAEGSTVPNSYLVAIADDCPVGVHEARVMTPWGLSSSRIFSVGNLQEVVQAEPSPSPEAAMAITIDSVCNAVMPVRAVNHYRFDAKQDQRVIVDCAAGGIDSKLNPVLIVADAEGRDLVVERRGDLLEFVAPDDGRYLIKVHELTFKGGPDFYYRLALREWNGEGRPERLPSSRPVNTVSWPPPGLTAEAATSETEPNDDSAQPIAFPCDLAGVFFPAADVDVFEFDAKKGEVWWMEVASERLGLPTDPSILVQRVPADAAAKPVDVAELTDIASPVKVSSNHYSYDGPPYDAGSTDVLGKVEIPEDGRYRLQLLDLFGGTRSDERNRYRLIVRRPQPDFALVGWGLHMELRNGDRNALSKPIALRPGATMALEIVVIRRDGFDGEIELAMEGLPEGVTARGLKIPAGGSRGMMLVTAAEHAPPGRANAQFYGRAKIGGETVTRPCRLASMAWPVQDAWSEIPIPRLVADVPVSVGGVEPAPITIAPSEQKVWEAIAGQPLTLSLVHARRSDFSGATVAMRTMGAGFEHNPPFDLPLTSDESQVVLDLQALNVPPGDYCLAFYGAAVAKYVAPSLLGGKDPPPSGSAQDIADIVVSEPITIRVKPAEQQ